MHLAFSQASTRTLRYCTAQSSGVIPGWVQKSPPSDSLKWHHAVERRESSCVFVWRHPRRTWRMNRSVPRSTIKAWGKENKSVSIRGWGRVKEQSVRLLGKMIKCYAGARSQEQSSSANRDSVPVETLKHLLQKWKPKLNICATHSGKCFLDLHCTLSRL